MLLLFLYADGQAFLDYSSVYVLDDVLLCLYEICTSLLQLVGLHIHTNSYGPLVCRIREISCFSEIG